MSKFTNNLLGVAILDLKSGAHKLIYSRPYVENGQPSCSSKSVEEEVASFDRWLKVEVAKTQVRVAEELEKFEQKLWFLSVFGEKRVVCSSRENHDFFRDTSYGMSFYRSVPLGVENFRCTGKHDLNPFGPDSCGKPPVEVGR